MNWLTDGELQRFKSCGTNVKVSRNASIYGHENIAIGSNVRIDDSVIILAASGYMSIGNYVHLAARSTFGCGGGIEIDDFAQVASHCLILSGTDDFSGEHLIGPTVPDKMRKVYKGRVYLGVGSVVGAGCVINAGTTFGMGSATGAMSMTTKDQNLKPNHIYVGIPAKVMKERSWDHFDLMNKFA